MSVSTSFSKASIASSATLARRRPSNKNGLVTMATDRIPFSRNACAITGKAPDPVPPPMPAFKKTISALPISSRILSRSSSADRLPSSGLAPVPNPLVDFTPICTFFSAFESSNA